jgi:hypothetical protein
LKSQFILGEERIIFFNTRTKAKSFERPSFARNDNKMAQSARIKQLIADLFSKDEKKVLKTLSILEGEGTADVIKPICECYQENISSKVNEKIVEFLNNLSDSTAAPELVDVLRDDDFKNMRQILLGACWQSKLDMSPFIADFVSIATDGELLEAFECTTIIDNLEGPFEEGHLLESQLYLKEYLEISKGKNEHVDELISDIAILIKDFDRALQS